MNRSYRDTLKYEPLGIPMKSLVESLSLKYPYQNVLKPLGILIETC